MPRCSWCWLFTSAALWLLIEAEFLAIILVLVYVGAVMVLFLFVVMMLDLNVDPVRGFHQVLAGRRNGGVVDRHRNGAGGGIRLLYHRKSTIWFRTRPITAIPLELGSVLYTFYVYPFEIASVILLVAIIAAISLTMRRAREPSPKILASRFECRRDNR